MDGYQNVNGGIYNGQYKQFGSAPSVEIKFEQEIPGQQYGYTDPQYSQQPYGQEYCAVTNSGIQEVPIQTYYGNDVSVAVPTGDSSTPGQNISPQANKKVSSSPVRLSSFYPPC